MISQDIDFAVDLLLKGEVIGFPTETVYGLAGNALDEKVVAKIFEIKGRPFYNPLIIHTFSFENVGLFAKSIPENAKKLAAAFVPGALTFILPKQSIVPEVVTAKLPTVAIRIPAHPIALELLGRLPFPLAAPSANPFGYISPTTAQHVEEQLGNRLRLILNGGPCAIGLESTIVGFEDERVVVYRQGAITIEQLKTVVKDIVVQDVVITKPLSAGMLPKHYSPQTPFCITKLDIILQTFQTEEVAILSFEKKQPSIPSKNQFILSEKGDLNEAAQRLYQGLRWLDAKKLKIILGEWLPDKEIGWAINDKLKRAINIEIQ